MVEIHAFPPAFGVSNASPFALKLQAYCELADIEYTMRYRSDSHKMPKKKLPVAVIEGKQVADSGFILATLEKRYQLDKALSPQQHAQGYFLQELVEEKLYWCLVYSRWCDEDNWSEVKKMLFGKAPWFLRVVVSEIVRKNIRKSLFAQGLGRHSKDEIYNLGKQGIEHLSAYLGSNDYFITDRMTQYDCALYATLTNFLNGQLDTPLKSAVLACPNLVAYITRCKEQTGV